jgi:cytochrome P450
MQRIDELDLPFLEIDDPAYRTNPWPFFEAARRQHPWLAKTKYGYYVHGYHALKEIAIQPDGLKGDFSKIVEYYGAEDTAWAKFQVEQLLGLTGDKHRRIRATVGDAFTPRNVNKHLDQIRRNCAELLDQWVPSAEGKIDFALFTSYFPISVLCALLGTTTAEVPRLRHSLETQTKVASMDPKIVPDLLEGYGIMAEFCDRLVADRIASGKDEGNLLDQLIACRTSGRIDDEELRYLLMILFPAGYDTSKNIMSLICYHLLDRPDDWKRCAAEAEFAYKVTDEMLRYNTVASPMRLTMRDIDYEGVRIPAGTSLIMGYTVSGRDPSAFVDADKLEPERTDTNRHVAFGRGAHICLGQHLARTQIAEGIHRMAQRITNPRLAGTPVWRPFMGVWGLESLPIEFDPA